MDLDRASSTALSLTPHDTLVPVEVFAAVEDRGTMFVQIVIEGLMVDITMFLSSISQLPVLLSLLLSFLIVLERGLKFAVATHEVSRPLFRSRWIVLAQMNRMFREK